MLRTTLLVGLGGFAGTMLRFWFGNLVKGNTFPATLFINITGCLLIGLVMGMNWKNTNWPLILGAGFCGGFTTFSAFSLENILLLEKGKFATAGLYILLSLAGGLFATWIGFKLMTK